METIAPVQLVIGKDNIKTVVGQGPVQVFQMADLHKLDVRKFFPQTQYYQFTIYRAIINNEKSHGSLHCLLYQGWIGNSQMVRSFYIYTLAEIVQFQTEAGGPARGPLHPVAVT